MKKENEQVDNSVICPEVELQKLWKSYLWIERFVISQAEPYYYNWIGVVIEREINFINLLKTLEEAESTEITEIHAKFQDLQKYFVSNHPQGGIIVNELSTYAEGSIEVVMDKKIGWMPPVEKLTLLYDYFKRMGKLGNDESFVEHFIGNEKINSKTKWLGKDIELVQLFSFFIDKGIIPHHQNYIVLITEHFCRMDGKAFNLNSLRALKSRPSNAFVYQFIQKYGPLFT